MEQTGLRRAFDRAPELAPAPEFTARLRRVLQREQVSMARQARRRAFFEWLAAAAVFAIACTGLLWVYQAALGETLVAAAVGDHRYCVVTATGPLSLDTETLQRPAYRRLDALPQTMAVPPAGELRVLERHVCVYGGRQFAHLVMRYRGRRVSLVVSGAAEAVRAQSGSTRVDGMNVVTFRSRSLTCFIIGELSLMELQTIATLIDQQLHQP
jgi:anti-sigma factor RsiW